MKARQSPTSPVRRRRALTVTGATAAAVLPWIAARAGGVELEVTTGGQPITVDLLGVVSAALAASLAGWGVLALLERLTSRARRIWTAIAVAVLLVSLVPLLVAEAAIVTVVYLALMHVAVGTVLIPGLPGGGSPSDARSR
jgi:hypothetical protein